MSSRRGFDVTDASAERGQQQIRQLSYPVQESFGDPPPSNTPGRTPLSSQTSKQSNLSSLDSGFMSGNTTTPLASPTSPSARQMSLTEVREFLGEVSDSVYRMDHAKRGMFIIINNRMFHRSTGLGERAGTDNDAANLYTTFKKIGFDIKMYNNQTVAQMLKVVIDASKEDHGNCDCFAMAILSHGDEGVVYGTDCVITVERLVAPLKGCPTLLGKPKLFFIQACRGYSLDEGVDVSDAEVDKGKDTRRHRIPLEADFLYSYSTAPGFYSFRNSTKGSWFIQALAEVFQDYGDKIEILRLLTRVNRKVAIDYESKTADQAFDRKKQVPSVVSMLTKELYFPKK